jgi:GTPase KRas protein
VCIYSITSRSSFEELANFLRAKAHLTNDVPISLILVGNKCDMEDSRVVSTLEGHDLAKSLGCQFLEASAKSGINVEQSYYHLVRDIRKRQSLDAEKGHKKLGPRRTYPICVLS